MKLNELLQKIPGIDLNKLGSHNNSILDLELDAIPERHLIMLKQMVKAQLDIDLDDLLPSDLSSTPLTSTSISVETDFHASSHLPKGMDGVDHTFTTNEVSGRVVADSQIRTMPIIEANLPNGGAGPDSKNDEKSFAPPAGISATSPDIAFVSSEGKPLSSEQAPIIVEDPANAAPAEFKESKKTNKKSINVAGFDWDKTLLSFFSHGFLFLMGEDNKDHHPALKQALLQCMGNYENKRQFLKELKEKIDYFFIHTDGREYELVNEKGEPYQPLFYSGKAAIEKYCEALFGKDWTDTITSIHAFTSASRAVAITKSKLAVSQLQYDDLKRVIESHRKKFLNEDGSLSKEASDRSGSLKPLEKAHKELVDWVLDLNDPVNQRKALLAEEDGLIGKALQASEFETEVMPKIREQHPEAEIEYLFIVDDDDDYCRCLAASEQQLKKKFKAKHIVIIHHNPEDPYTPPDLNQDPMRGGEEGWRYSIEAKLSADPHHQKSCWIRASSVRDSDHNPVKRLPQKTFYENFATEVIHGNYWDVCGILRIYANNFLLENKINEIADLTIEAAKIANSLSIENIWPQHFTFFLLLERLATAAKNSTDLPVVMACHKVLSHPEVEKCFANMRKDQAIVEYLMSSFASRCSGFFDDLPALFKFILDFVPNPAQAHDPQNSNLVVKIMSLCQNKDKDKVLEIIQCLMDKHNFGAKTHPRDSNTALSYALGYGKDERSRFALMKYLVAKGADINAATGEECEPLLIQFVKKFDLFAVKFVCEETTANLNVHGYSSDDNVLDIACNHLGGPSDSTNQSRYEVVNYLRGRGLRPSRSLNHALHNCVEYFDKIGGRHVDYLDEVSLKFLCDNFTLDDEALKYLRGCRNVACRILAMSLKGDPKRFELCDYLIGKGFKIIEARQGWDDIRELLLFEFTLNDDFQGIEYAIKHGIDVFTLDEQGKTIIELLEENDLTRKNRFTRRKIGPKIPLSDNQKHILNYLRLHANERILLLSQTDSAKALDLALRFINPDPTDADRFKIIENLWASGHKPTSQGIGFALCKYAKLGDREVIEFILSKFEIDPAYIDKAGHSIAYHVLAGEYAEYDDDSIKQIKVTEVPSKVLNQDPADSKRETTTHQPQIVSQTSGPESKSDLAVDAKASTPAAPIHKRRELCRYLLAKGFKLTEGDISYPENYNLLFKTAFRGDLAGVKFLQENGFDLFSKSKSYPRQNLIEALESIAPRSNGQNEVLLYLQGAQALKELRELFQARLAENTPAVMPAAEDEKLAASLPPWKAANDLAHMMRMESLKQQQQQQLLAGMQNFTQQHQQFVAAQTPSLFSTQPPDDSWFFRNLSTPVLNVAAGKATDQQVTSPAAIEQAVAEQPVIEEKVMFHDAHPADSKGDEKNADTKRTPQDAKTAPFKVKSSFDAIHEWNAYLASLNRELQAVNFHDADEQENTEIQFHYELSEQDIEELLYQGRRFLTAGGKAQQLKNICENFLKSNPDKSQLLRIVRFITAKILCPGQIEAFNHLSDLEKRKIIDAIKTKATDEIRQEFAGESEECQDLIIQAMHEIVERSQKYLGKDKPFEQIKREFAGEWKECREVRFPLPKDEIEIHGQRFLSINELHHQVAAYNYHQFNERLNALRTICRQQFNANNGSVALTSPEANELLAMIRERYWHTTGIYVNDVQMMDVLALIHDKEKRRLLQIKTGEGKSTIIAILSAYYGVLGLKPDVVTTHDDLALRDIKKLAPFYNSFGLKVGYCHRNKDCDPTADILYGTFHAFQGNYLGNKMDIGSRRGNRPFDICLVDEADFCFIDSKNMDLRLLFGAENNEEKIKLYQKVHEHFIPLQKNPIDWIEEFADSIKPPLTELEAHAAAVGLDPQNNAEDKKIWDEWVAQYYHAHRISLQKEIKIDGTVKSEAAALLHKWWEGDREYFLNQVNPERKRFYEGILEHFDACVQWIMEQAVAMKQELKPDEAKNIFLNWMTANFTMQYKKHFIVSKKGSYIDQEEDEIEFIDLGNTDQRQQNTRYGLVHTFLEIKYGIRPKVQDQIVSKTNNIEYLKLYKYGCKCVTGTAGESYDRKELDATTGIKCYDSPMSKPDRRKRLDSMVVPGSNAQGERTKQFFSEALVKEVNTCVNKVNEQIVSKERPVLIFADSIRESEEYARLMRFHFGQDKVQVYNAVQGDTPEHITELAAQPGMITIVTNIGGRGMDVSADLHVIFTHLFKNRRVEGQALGRTGRQGLEGTYRYLLTWEEIAAHLGMPVAELIQKYGADPEAAINEWYKRQENAAVASLDAELYRLQVYRVVQMFQDLYGSIPSALKFDKIFRWTPFISTVQEDSMEKASGETYDEQIDSAIQIALQKFVEFWRECRLAEIDENLLNNLLHQEQNKQLYDLLVKHGFAQELKISISDRKITAAPQAESSPIKIEEAGVATMITEQDRKLALGSSEEQLVVEVVGSVVDKEKRQTAGSSETRFFVPMVSGKEATVISDKRVITTEEGRALDPLMHRPGQSEQSKIAPAVISEGQNVRLVAW